MRADARWSPDQPLHRPTDLLLEHARPTSSPIRRVPPRLNRRRQESCGNCAPGAAAVLRAKRSGPYAVRTCSGGLLCCRHDTNRGDHMDDGDKLLAVQLEQARQGERVNTQHAQYETGLKRVEAKIAEQNSDAAKRDAEGQSASGSWRRRLRSRTPMRQSATPRGQSASGSWRRRLRSRTPMRQSATPRGQSASGSWRRRLRSRTPMRQSAPGSWRRRLRSRTPTRQSATPMRQSAPGSWRRRLRSRTPMRQSATPRRQSATRTTCAGKSGCGSRWS